MGIKFSKKAKVTVLNDGKKPRRKNNVIANIGDSSESINATNEHNISQIEKTNSISSSSNARSFLDNNYVEDKRTTNNNTTINETFYEILANKQNNPNTPTLRGRHSFDAQRKSTIYTSSSRYSSATLTPHTFHHVRGMLEDYELEEAADNVIKGEILKSYDEKYGVNILGNHNEISTDLPLDVTPLEEEQFVEPYLQNYSSQLLMQPPYTPHLYTPKTAHKEKETNEYDDEYYTATERAKYEKPKPKADEGDDSLLNIRLQKGQLLGSGGYSRVYMGLNLDTGELIAIKQINLVGDILQKEKDIESFKKEVAVMKHLRHDNIVRYLGTSIDDENLNIFLEYVPGGSISSLLAKFGVFSEQVIKVYTCQILVGLQYLHSHHIIHHDIKGANILVSNAGVIKLADFNASKRLEGLVTGGYNSLKGTPYWMAPEVIKQSGHGRQADIWSVGCTIIEMSTGKPPFSELSDPVAVLFRIASSDELPFIPTHLSPEGKDFLTLCFCRDPKFRPNATKLLTHPFLHDTYVNLKVKWESNNSSRNSTRLVDGRMSSTKRYSETAMIETHAEVDEETIKSFLRNKQASSFVSEVGS
eukprot:TRINITY_DN4878_c0_g1_i1.p1 TRINITY_DN4878_c0_g1~~TRINITY_DN4878_c0_g1_i1.p1  ORF type:complete len:588 (-),score=164.58 TRINITY_DN4878_c0_g1_i1:221-1984(-)